MKLNVLCKAPTKGRRLVSLKMLLTMKLTLVLVIAACMQVNAGGYAQKITLSQENVSLAKLFHEIRDQSGYLFLYNDKQLNDGKKVTIKVKDASIEEVLKQSFKDQLLTYAIVEKTIVVIPKAEIKEPDLIPAVLPPPPPIEIHGRVVNQQGQPLQNVSVLITGTQTGTTTNSEGRFSLTAPDDKNVALEISSVGYQTKRVSVGKQTEVNIVLELDVAGLSDVVVVGYGTQKKSDLTGAVSVVNTSDIQSTPVAGIDKALNGRVAGVSVFDSKQPGGGVAVRIRGFGTINNNDPLYIIDGIPVTNGINNINPADIETIQVLKDASSASIYGARASNGVIIITTKTAKSGKMQLTYDGYAGTQKVMNLPQLLDADQYGQLWFTALSNGGQSPPAGNPYGTSTKPVIPEYLDAAKTIVPGNTNWLKEITRPGLIQSHSLSLLNGSDKSHTSFGLGYYRQKGILKYTSGFKRYSARFNSDYLFFNRLKIGEYATVSNIESRSVSENAALGSVLNSVYFADPILPVYDIDGNFSSIPMNMPLGGRNPLSSLNSAKNDYTKTWRFLGKVFADFTIVNGLVASTNFAIDYINYDSKTFNPTFTEGTQTNPVNSLSLYNSYTLSTTWTNTLNYKKRFTKNSLDILVGTEYIKGTTQNFGAGRSDFPSNDILIQQLNAGALSPTNNGIGSEKALFSVFGKINYSYLNKYLASITLRNDASSRFPTATNQQTFPAFSLGWRLSDETFFSSLLGFINGAKIRVGWGQVGNQEIDDYSYFSTYAPNLTIDNSYYDINGSNSNALTGYSQNRIGNEQLLWETSTQTNIGFDLQALDNRINFTLNLFDKKTNDLLVQPPLPATFGAASAPFINGGSMQNRGIEVELGYNSHRSKAFTYSIEGNFSYIKNKLTGLAPDLEFIASPVSNTLTRNLELQRSIIGAPIASFYGYKVIGIFQTQQEVNSYLNQPGKAVGHFIYEDITGDGIIDDKDRVILGSPIPTWTYGLNIRLNYKNLDLWAFGQGVAGNKIFDFTRVYSDFFASFSSTNKSVRLLDAWSTTNMISNGPPIITTKSTANDTRPSTYFIQNGSYLRLKTLQLGYTISEFFKRGGEFRVYLQVENLFTITQYDGMDPEVGMQNYSSSDRNLDIGVDRGIYPAYRTFIFGINLKL